MKTYEFSIIASGLDPQAEDFDSRFYGAGCDDATVSFQKGRIIIDFAREAESIEDAIVSAISDVLEAGAHVEHVEPDPLVSLSDIAARANMSRAAISLYSKAQRGKGFPAPVARVTSDSPLWDWSGVAVWLFQQSRISQDCMIEAAVVKSANLALQRGSVPNRDELRQRASEIRASLN